MTEKRESEKPEKRENTFGGPYREYTCGAVASAPHHQTFFRFPALAYATLGLYNIGNMADVKLRAIDPRNSTPRYVQAKAILVDAIRGGVFPPGAKLPATAEISDCIRVSLLTAHRAIQALAAEGWLERRQGRGTFVRTDVGRRLRGHEYRRIGLVVDPVVHLGDYYHGALMHGLRAAMASLMPGAELSVRLQTEVGVAPNGPADGFIFLHPFAESFPGLEVLAEDTPLVVLGGSLPTTAVQCVDSANRAGAQEAVSHLATLHHRRIAVVNGHLSSTNSADRFAGYQDAMKQHGLAIPRAYVLNAGDAQMPDAIRKRLAALLRSADRPSAVLAAGYTLALQVMEVAAEVGLRIPRDLSLVGFDDPRSAALLDPPLTTVRQPLDEMARLAVARLQLLLKGKPAQPPAQILPTRLIVRGSTAPPPRRLNGR